MSCTRNDSQSLFHAVKTRKLSQVKSLILKGVSTNIRDEKKATPLHYAVQKGSIDIVKLLLQYNAQPFVLDRKEAFPLQIACVQGNVRMVETLLANRGSDDTPLAKIITLLHQTIKAKQQDITNLLLRQINNRSYQKDPKEHTPLDLAAQKGYLKVLQALLQPPNNDSLSKRNIHTALSFAIQKNHQEIIQELLTYLKEKQALDTQVSYIAVENKYGRTLLHYALKFASNTTKNILKMLLEKGLKPNSKDMMEMTLRFSFFSSSRKFCKGL